MDPNRLSKRTRQSLAALWPEQRERAEAALTRIQSPGFGYGPVPVPSLPNLRAQAIG
jgi:hypothetical protein